MGYCEHRRGIRSTYYVLPTAPYWNDPRLTQKCLQLTEFGHEVGLHLNSMPSWLKGESDSVEWDLRSALQKLREGGNRSGRERRHTAIRCATSIKSSTIGAFESSSRRIPSQRKAGSPRKACAATGQRRALTIPSVANYAETTKTRSSSGPCQWLTWVWSTMPCTFR